MAPRHRAAMESSGQEEVVGRRYQMTLSNWEYVDRIKELPRSGLVQRPVWGHDKSCTQVHAKLDVSGTQTNEEPVAGRSGVTVAAASVVKLSG